MRKPLALAALFPTVRGDVLAATLTQPEKWWFLSELAQSLGTSPSSLQRNSRRWSMGAFLRPAGRADRQDCRRSADASDDPRSARQADRLRIRPRVGPAQRGACCE